MKNKLFGCALALLLVMATTAGAADLRATGRDLAAKYGNAVIRVNVVINQKASFGGEDREEEVSHEINGTIIGEDGLTLVPLSNIDPSSMVKRMMGDQMNEQIKFETTVKDIKMLMADGKEVRATVVSRDSDLDLAFLRPTTKSDKKFTAINLADNANAQLLEEVVVLARFGKIANRRIGVMSGEVQGIIEKPRKFYVPSSELGTGGYGLPIFNENSKLVGFVMIRTMAGSRSADSDERTLGIIMPASDILEIAKQVPEKAVETPKPAASPKAKSTEKKTEEKAGEKPASEKPAEKAAK